MDPFQIALLAVFTTLASPFQGSAASSDGTLAPTAGVATEVSLSVQAHQDSWSAESLGTRAVVSTTQSVPVRRIEPLAATSAPATGTIDWHYQAYFGFFEPGESDPTRIESLGSYSHRGRAHLQWDTAFAGGHLFTSHAERWSAEGTRLVWRELAKGDGPGHTVVLEMAPHAQEVAVTRYGLRSRTHTQQPAPECQDTQARMPLQWWEALRTGQTIESPAHVLHPQTGRWEPVRILTLDAPIALAWIHPEQSALRYVRLQWLHSQTTSEFLFSGNDLVSYRLHARGPWAQAMTPQAWHRLHDDWHGQADFSTRSPRARAMEAAAPFLDKRARQAPLWWRNDGQPLDTSRLQRQRL